MFAVQDSISQRTRMTASMSPEPPDAASLHRAALDYVARYAATTATLAAVLERRIRRWSERAAQSAPDEVAARLPDIREIARAIVAQLVQAGAVNDSAFAEMRAKRLIRSGTSRPRIMAHLAAKGVDAATAATALPEDGDSDVLAALAFARRRRFGPFSVQASDAGGNRRALAAMGRAGFGRTVAQTVLRMDPNEARDFLRLQSRQEVQRADAKRAGNGPGPLD